MSSRSADAAITTYVPIVMAWLATRVYACVSVEMTPWILNDVDIYAGWAPLLRDGTFPVDDPTWQYPPGIAPVFLVAGALGLDYRWGFTLAILAVDAALMAGLLVAHARRGPSASWRGPWLWASAGLVVGSILMVRFDVVPTALAAGAVLLAASPVRSGVLAALGALTKVWPALVLLALPRRSLPRATVAAAATLGVVLGGYALLTEGSLSFLGNQRDRGLQIESLGALPYHWWGLLGGDVEFDLQYGSVQVVRPEAPAIGLAITVLGFLLLAVIAWCRLAGRLEAVPPGDVALAVLLVSVATSRVYSPQFNVWLIGVAAVAALDRASRLRVAILLVVAASLVTQVVYPWMGTQLGDGETLAIVLQTVRLGLLLSATVLSLLAVLRHTADRQQIGR